MITIFMFLMFSFGIYHTPNVNVAGKVIEKTVDTWRPLGQLTFFTDHIECVVEIYLYIII